MQSPNGFLDVLPLMVDIHDLSFSRLLQGKKPWSMVCGGGKQTATAPVVLMCLCAVSCNGHLATSGRSVRRCP